MTKIGESDCVLVLGFARVALELKGALYGALLKSFLVVFMANCQGSDCFILLGFAALVPEPKGALLGALEKGSSDWERIAGEAARTIPGRENGGNCDIKNLSRGCKVCVFHYFSTSPFPVSPRLCRNPGHMLRGFRRPSVCVMLSFCRPLGID
jgi:hypothetical protein